MIQDSLTHSDTISFVQAKHLLDTEPDCLLFDVREEEEFITGHPVEAELFTLDTIDAQTAELRIPSKDTPVLVYCRSGARSYEAAQRLLIQAAELRPGAIHASVGSNDARGAPVALVGAHLAVDARLRLLPGQPALHHAAELGLRVGGHAPRLIAEHVHARFKEQRHVQNDDFLAPLPRGLNLMPCVFLNQRM